MPLFVCTGCNAVDNTATAVFWSRPERNKALCSECGSGKWHGRFPKKQWSGARIQWAEGNFLTDEAQQMCSCGHIIFAHDEKFDRTGERVVRCLFCSCDTKDVESPEVIRVPWKDND